MASSRPGRRPPALVRARAFGTALPGSLVAALVQILLLAGSLEYGWGSVHLVLYAALLGAGAARLLLPPLRKSDWIETTRQTDLVLLPIAAVEIAASALGPRSSLLFPLVLVLLLWASASMSRRVLGIAVAYAAFAEVARFVGRGAWSSQVPDLVMHVLFVGGFAAVGYILLRSEVHAARQRAVQEAEEEEETAQEQARTLGISDETPNMEAPDARDRVASLAEAFSHLMRVARESTRAHSSVLMLRHDDDTYRVFVADTPEALTHEPAPAREGLLALVLRVESDDSLGDLASGLLVRRIHPYEPRRGTLPYHDETPARIRSVMALPLRRPNGETDGILFFDRTAGEGFSDDDAEQGRAVGNLLLRMMAVERAMYTSDARTRALDSLIASSRILARAFRPQETWKALLDAASHIHTLRFGALLVRRGVGGAARIVAAVGEGADRLQGSHVDTRAGDRAPAAPGDLLDPRNRSSSPMASPGTEPALATLVFELDEPAILPTSRQWRRSHGPLLGTQPGPSLADGDPLVVVPLRAHAGVVGALVLVSDLPFDDGAVSLLSLLASQGAVAVTHAQMLEDLEHQAQTDGLTRLDNRTTLNAKLDQSLARCTRLDQHLAVLILDIDHFKRVNDTYGHPAGDTVLRRVARVLEESKRLGDSVGRYGGEEFLLVLENTGDDGARIVAERIRERIERMNFASGDGSFQVTASIGFAISPRDGKRPDDLVKRADAALYQAKKTGRNRVVGYRDVMADGVAPVSAE